MKLDDMKAADLAREATTTALVQMVCGLRTTFVTRDDSGEPAHVSFPQEEIVDAAAAELNARLPPRSSWLVR
jgi:hypothetical protein